MPSRAELREVGCPLAPKVVVREKKRNQELRARTIDEVSKWGLRIPYAVDLICLVENHGFIHCMYADDSQINGSRHPGSAGRPQYDLSSGLDEVSAWMCANWIQ